MGANAAACAGALLAAWAFHYPSEAADYIAEFQNLIEQSATDVARIAESSDEIRDNTSILASDVRVWLETSLLDYENDGEHELVVHTWNSTNRPIRDIGVVALLDDLPIISGETVLQAMAYEVFEAEERLTLSAETRELIICVRGFVEGATGPTYELQVYPISNGSVDNRSKHEKTDAPIAPCPA